MLSSTKSRNSGKRLLLLFVLLFTVFFSYTVVAQEMGSIRKSVEYSFPEKVHKPVLDPLPAGTYSVGTGGYFATIQAAFDKLSIDGISGEVILELTDNLYTAPAVQFGYSLNGPIPGAGPNSRVTIKPAVNKNVTIEGNNECVLYLFNTSYVTFDGVGLTGVTTLTIHALQNSNYGFNDALDFMNNSDHNIIENVTFIVDDIFRASGAGFWFVQTTADVPDSNLIQNNFVKKAGLGLYIVCSTTGVKGKGNLIRGNHIGSIADSLVSFGIQVAGCENTLIENNIIENLKTTLNGSTQFKAGIFVLVDNNDIVRNNNIGNFRAQNGYSTSGIHLSGDGINKGNNVLVYNNMIYNIQSTSAQNDSRVIGIEISNQNNPKIYYNSVYLSGTGSQKLGSAALYIGGGNTGIDAENNILVNTRDDGQYCASAIFGYTSSSLNSDYNDLYYDDTKPNNCLVRIATTNYHTIAEWQVTGKDFHTVSIMPCFTSSGLHIDHTTATCLESRGTPIPGIDIDFDGEPRHTYLPDIGADEFDGLIPTGPLTFGAYSVGIHGFFSSIENIFNKLETDGVAGMVTLELIDELYTASTDTFGFKLNGPIPGTGPNSRVTIKPAENKKVLIQGSGRDQLAAINTSYVTIDGVSLTGPTTLTIHALYNNQFGWNAGIEFIDNSDHNIFRNITFISDDINRSGGGPGLFTRMGINAVADSNLIENNFIKKCGAGAIYLAFDNANLRGTGNIIRGNFLGSETDSVLGWGIQVEHAQNTIIENNIIQNLKHTPTQLSNIINVGINSYSGLEDIIRNNVVHGVRSSSGYSAIGILLSGGSGSNCMVYNNMIYDIQSTSTQSNSRLTGIQIWNQANPKIYYNTVYLSGVGNGANPLGSAALYIYGGFSGSPGVDLKNNIFVNTRDESPYCASAVYDYNIYNLTSDYNDLYYDDTYPNNCLVRLGTTNYNTLAEWQVLGKDPNSISEMPNFVALEDLHIDGNFETLLDKGATPIVGIETDFDGETRNVTTPDIGADEFTIVGVEDELQLPTKYSLEQNYPNPFNPTTTFRYSIPQTSKVVIKVYDILGNEITLLIDEEKTIGTYELTWDAASLPSGVYFYQLKAGDPSTGSGQVYVNTKKMILLK